MLYMQWYEIEFQMVQHIFKITFSFT